jgi:hypothetical protein
MQSRSVPVVNVEYKGSVESDSAEDLKTLTQKGEDLDLVAPGAVVGNVSCQWVTSSKTAALLSRMLVVNPGSPPLCRFLTLEYYFVLGTNYLAGV